MRLPVSVLLTRCTDKLPEYNHAVGGERLTPVGDTAISAEVERILESDTFRNADALRRLLKFLTDKMLSGEADQLKEYSVGIDALGKPPTYDPRHDSTVRIQVGRLRQKLAEYYRTEGKDDPLIVDLPKGRFKLTCEESPSLAGAATEVAYAPSSASAAAALQVPPKARWSGERIAIAVLGLVVLGALLWGTWATMQLWRERQESAIFRAMWTPELDQLWKPFFASNRPLIVSIADPPFVQFKGHGAYRDLTLNRWEDLIKSPDVLAIRKSLGNVDVQPNLYYAPVGEVNAAFFIGKLLGPRVQALSLLRTSELSLQQLADNNVLFIGAPVFFDNLLQGLPVRLELTNARPGIHNLHPRPGESAILNDQFAAGTAEDGEVHVLVTHVPGPLGTSQVESFTSNRPPGRIAAVEWFTNPNYARTLIDKLRKPNGEIPRYYQVVLKVKFKAGVPTETSYVLHREVHVTEQLGIPEPAVPTSSHP
ncbi:MAG TPA: hypothetical protein VG096_08670 [Bryobacteraceae bacterium]|jgi:hypothetical protein|nr:hypothetical protein [Bryobacteraceae bacterium]